ncbi:MAG: DUF1571 domain-containing protein [Planctomycetes bacterium]|nr:DUF1571 domain-containing protein [Planctomycetota bacterium]
MSPCRAAHARAICAVIALSTFGISAVWVAADPPQSKTPPRSPVSEAAPAILAATATITPAPAPRMTHEQVMDLAKSDPEAVWRLGIERYDREIKEYSCTFVKQEFVGGKLKGEETIDVRFRDQPQSVFMFWKAGTDRVKRALYVDSPSFRDGKGQKVAKIEPAGAVIRLLVSEVEMPIHGKDAKEASRRAIDEFGFRNTYKILERYNLIAAEKVQLEYRFEAEDKIDGRPTYRFARYLPYKGEKGEYPDAKMILHIDQEWLLPTAVYSYADREGKKLLGSYIYKNIKLNPGFTDQDFQF